MRASSGTAPCPGRVPGSVEPKSLPSLFEEEDGTRERLQTIPKETETLGASGQASYCGWSWIRKELLGGRRIKQTQPGPLEKPDAPQACLHVQLMHFG